MLNWPGFDLSRSMKALMLAGGNFGRVTRTFCETMYLATGTNAIMRNPTHADDAMWAELHAEFTEPELVELGHYIGFMSGGQRWLLTLHTQHGELAAEMAQRKAQQEKKELAPAGK